MDYNVLEIARTYSNDADSLIANYKKIMEGLSATESELVSFGNYLLSKERYDSYASLSGERLKERLSQVNHADIANWKDLNGK